MQTSYPKLAAGIVVAAVLLALLGGLGFMILMSGMGPVTPGSVWRTVAQALTGLTYVGAAVAAVACGACIAAGNNRLAVKAFAAPFIAVLLLYPVQLLLAYQHEQHLRALAAPPAGSTPAKTTPQAASVPEAGDPVVIGGWDSPTPGIGDWLSNWREAPLPGAIDLYQGFVELTLEGGYTETGFAPFNEPDDPANGDYRMNFAAPLLEDPDLPVRYSFSWAHTAELRDAPEGARIGIALFSSTESDPDQPVGGIRMRLLLPAQLKILTFDILRNHDEEAWVPVPVFDVSADGQWLRLTSEASPPIWLNHTAIGGPDGTYKVDVLGAAAIAARAFEVVPLDARTAIMAEPGSDGAVVSVFERDKARRGFLEPLGHQSGDWMRVAHVTLTGSAASHRCFNPGVDDYTETPDEQARRTQAGLAPGDAESRVEGWIRFRNGDRLMVDADAEVCTG